jgi:hypothetical protein
VENDGPPFQIDGSIFANWSREIGTRCPVMLRHLMNFLQPRVEFHENRSRPIPKSEIQLNLRVHAAAFLTASPATSKMTIETALKKLLGYAKGFGSEAVLEQLKTFVAQGVSYAAKPGETDDLVMASLLAVRMMQLLQTYHTEMDSQMRDHGDVIVAPMPFISVRR